VVQNLFKGSNVELPSPAELLQALIRFNTSNPPGAEAACIAYIDGLLHDVGIETTLLEKEPGRPNLIARLKGSGSAPPMLLYGHVDVVPVDGQTWTHPPFNAEIHDGFIWGRGALDMKGGVAMLVSAFLRAHTEKLALPGDLILCVVSDEERGGDAGARFLVNEHPDLFKGVRYALGEFGGFSYYLGGKKFYLIQVSEKQGVWLRATLHGPAGHASAPIRGGAMAKLGKMLTALDENRLPVHVTTAARNMIEAIAAHLDAPLNHAMLGLLDPVQTDTIMEAMGDQALTLNPLLHNTVSPTVIRTGQATNVIPASVTLDMDARLLPGFDLEEFMAELGAIIGDDVELERFFYDPGPGEPDMGLFDTLADILKKADPTGIPIPFLLTAVTDARFFARLGIQTYGFLPMLLPEDFNFNSVIHAADERVPVESVGWGTDRIYEVLSRFGDQ
jgi:acetylornithine deacetylase/succinyl-diaminopimelate desuccinylase-like protein